MANSRLQKLVEDSQELINPAYEREKDLSRKVNQLLVETNDVVKEYTITSKADPSNELKIKVIDITGGYLLLTSDKHGRFHVKKYMTSSPKDALADAAKIYNVFSSIK